MFYPNPKSHKKKKKLLKGRIVILSERGIIDF